MQDQGVGEAGAKVMDAVVMLAIELCKLFRNDFDWQIFELKGQGHDLVFEMGAMISNSDTPGIY